MTENLPDVIKALKETKKGYNLFSDGKEKIDYFYGLINYFSKCEMIILLNV